MKHSLTPTLSAIGLVLSFALVGPAAAQTTPIADPQVIGPELASDCDQGGDFDDADDAVTHEPIGPALDDDELGGGETEIASETVVGPVMLEDQDDSLQSDDGLGADAASDDDFDRGGCMGSLRADDDDLVVGPVLADDDSSAD